MGGNELTQRQADILGAVWAGDVEIDHGIVYMNDDDITDEIKPLVEAGLVELLWEEEDGRPYRYYELTDAGLDAIGE